MIAGERLVVREILEQAARSFILLDHRSVVALIRRLFRTVCSEHSISWVSSTHVVCLC